MAESGQDPSRWGWQHGPGADIVPFSFDGHRFPGGVARLAAPFFTRALDRLVAQPGFSLPASRDLDAGMWGYQDRRIGGSNNWSFHAYGLAIDIAAPWNPQGANPPAASAHRLPGDTGSLLRDLGLEWGGDWGSSVDWMHIELHLSKADAGAGAGLPPAPPAPDGTPFPLPAGYYFGPYEGPAESISGSGRDDARWRPFLARAQTALGTPADGYYGPATAAATRSWQTPRALQVDGLIGPATWRSLDL